MDACAQNQSKHTCSNTCFNPSEMRGSDMPGDKVPLYACVVCLCLFWSWGVCGGWGDAHILGIQLYSEGGEMKPSYHKYIELFSM